MKKSLSGLALLLLLAPAAQAGIWNVLTKKTLTTTLEYGKNTRVGFELWNKTQYDVCVIVSNGTAGAGYADDRYFEEGVTVLKPNDVDDFDDATTADPKTTGIDPTKDIFIRIYDDHSRSPFDSKTGSPNTFPSMVYRIPGSAKTKYLKIDEPAPFAVVKPQSGSKLVAALSVSKTDTGYLLNNNVDDKEILTLNMDTRMLLMKTSLLERLRRNQPLSMKIALAENYSPLAILQDIVTMDSVKDKSTLFANMVTLLGDGINEKGFLGDTLLHYAVTHCGSDMVAILLSSPKIRTDITNEVTALTPLQLARFKVDPEAAKAFYEKFKNDPTRILDSGTGKRLSAYAWETVAKRYNFGPPPPDALADLKKTVDLLERAQKKP